MNDDIDLYEIWDYLEVHGENVILEWVKNERLTKRSRAALNQKIKRLSQMDYSLAVSSKMLAHIYRHVHKLIIKADIMLRPMLCRGPIDNLKEYTFLLGVIETGGKLPKGSKEEAAHRREIIIRDKNRRRKHERIPESA
jgi:hypothetical protein